MRTGVILSCNQSTSLAVRIWQRTERDACGAGPRGANFFSARDNANTPCAHALGLEKKNSPPHRKCTQMYTMNVLHTSTRWLSSLQAQTLI